MKKINLKENERIDDLEYKNLKIIQNIKGFCFGIDSVLLSEYAKNLKEKSKVVDIGCGTGIISILLSKKSKAEKIYGIEIQNDVADMAQRSVQMNDLEDIIEILNIDVKNIFSEIEPNSMDVVVTNPPYMKNNSGAKNEEEKKLISRHEIACTLEDIIKISYRLLKSNGEFYMIHRTERLVDIFYLCRKYSLEPKSIRMIQSSIYKASNLVLIKAVKNAGEQLTIEKPLIIYNEDGTYTDEILKIYNKI